ncbi:MAG: hypothetical protein WC124_02225 [Desulfoplanes sp.]
MAITIEQLAAEEHKQWAAWATDILNTEVVSSQRAARWVELIQTEYENLSEEMKELDRREVRLHVLPIIDRLMQENQQLKEQIIKYKRSIEIGDDR